MDDKVFIEEYEQLYSMLKIFWDDKKKRKVILKAMKELINKLEL